MSDARRPPADDGDADSDGGGGGGWGISGEPVLCMVLSLYCGRRYWEVLLLSFYHLLAYISDAHIYFLIVLFRFNIQSVHLSVFLYLIIMIIYHFISLVYTQFIFA